MIAKYFSFFSFILFVQFTNISPDMCAFIPLSICSRSDLVTTSINVLRKVPASLLFVQLEVLFKDWLSNLKTFVYKRRACCFQDSSPLPWSFPFTFLPAFVTTLHFEMIATYPQTSVFAMVWLLSILCPFPSTFLFESPLPFVIPSFNFYLPSEAHYSVCLPPSASLFIRNKVVGSRAFLSQQSASSSWRKLTRLHCAGASFSKRHRRTYPHPCSLPLIWCWNPEPFIVCPPTYSILEFHFPPTCCFV